MKHHSNGLDGGGAWEVKEIEINLHSQSFRCFAFEVTSILRDWATNIKEIAIDSACELGLIYMFSLVISS